MKKSVLVTLADENYVDQAKQLFSSAYFNGGWKGDFLLLSAGISEKHLKDFRKKGIIIRKVEKLNLKIPGKWPVTALNKIEVFKPFFKKWKNVVFLDGDMIIRASLSDLESLEGFWGISSQKKVSKLFLTPAQLRLRGASIKKYSLLKKFNLKKQGFNGGLMAFSTNIIKKNTFHEIYDLVKEFGEISASAEEAVTNLYFLGKWKSLQLVYNLQPDINEDLLKIKPEEAKAIILHFVSRKPWKKESFFYNEWESNLKKFDKIGKNPKIKAKKWSKQQIQDYENYLFKKKKESWLREKKQKIITKLDSYAGIAGMLLKKISPEVHFKLKKLLNNQERIINIFRNDPKNIGDIYSTPARYFSSLKKAKLADISKKLPNLKDRVVILGGGGLLNHPPFEKNVELVKNSKARRIICWGAGENSAPGGKPQPEKLKDFDLIGVRDSWPELRWVPCPSCMHSCFDKKYKIKRKIAVFESKFVKIPIKGYPKMSSTEKNLDKIAKFLGEAEIVLTNTYHGIYWATLLNKKVIIIEPLYSSKFDFLKYKHPKANIDSWKSKIHKTKNYPNALKECRDSNKKFAKLVEKLIHNDKN